MRKYNSAADLRHIAATVSQMAASGTYGHDMTYNPPRAEFVIGNLTLRCIDTPDAIQALIRRYDKNAGKVKPIISAAFKWVAKAVAKHDRMEALNYVYVTPEWITGTDGQRMHRVPNTDNMAPGFYLKTGEMIESWKTEELQYPDVTRVIPTSCECDPVDVDSLVYSEAFPDTSKEVKTACYSIPEKGNITVNRQYLADALAGLPDPWILGRVFNPRLRIDSKVSGGIAIVVGLRLE